MSQKPTPSLALVKIASLGDVAIAANALRRSFARVPKESRPRVTWLIDPEFIPLARALTAGIATDFAAVSSARLLRGGLSEKILEATGIARTINQIAPAATAVLHRDSRYGALLRILSMSEIQTISPRPFQNEGSTYEETLDRALRAMGVATSQGPAPHGLSRRPAAGPAPLERIALFLGGGQNAQISYREKTWPHFSKIARLLLDHTPCTLLLFGGPGDQPAAAELLSGIAPRYQPRVKNLVGSLSFAELPFALGQAQLLLTTDSGIAHVAAAVFRDDQTMLSLFGPTDCSVWRPLDSVGRPFPVLKSSEPCSPCYRNDGVFSACRFSGKDFQRCMTGLSAEQVLQAILQLIN